MQTKSTKGAQNQSAPKTTTQARKASNPTNQAAPAQEPTPNQATPEKWWNINSQDVPMEPVLHFWLDCAANHPLVQMDMAVKDKHHASIQASLFEMFRTTIKSEEFQRIHQENKDFIISEYQSIAEIVTTAFRLVKSPIWKEVCPPYGYEHELNRANAGSDVTYLEIDTDLGGITTPANR